MSFSIYFLISIIFPPQIPKLYHHLSLFFFEKIRLPDIPKDIPRHTPIPIPAMLFKTFIKTTLQSIAAVIPIVTPIIILLLFISFILHKFRFVGPLKSKSFNLRCQFFMPDAALEDLAVHQLCSFAARHRASNAFKGVARS